MVVDLRSDTVTTPSPEMRAAMAAAPVGDDVYGEDPTVIALEQRVAAIFGHEAGLFVPSGTMGNQIAMRLLVEPGTEILTDCDAHVVIYEMGAPAAVSGIQTRTFPSTRGIPDVDRLVAMVRTPAPYSITTAAVALENTHNVAGGAVIPLEVIKQVRKATRERDVAMHCDGARVWNAMAATGDDPRELGACFDTISVCLSKGLGAPVGSVVVTSHERIGWARTIRKRLGGGMRQAGILAAAGLYALDHNLDHLGEDHRRARELASAVGADAPDTNIVLLDVAAPIEVATAAAAQGVLVSPFGPTRLRVVTHLDIDDGALATAIEVLSRLV